MNWADIFQRKKYKWPKTHEEMLNITGYKWNVNQNHIKILPHSRQYDFPQENE
jgi:hypothetical protein